MVQKVLHFATKTITCICTVSCIIVTCSFLSHKINIIINKIAEIGCMIILAIWFITTTHWRANSVKWTPVISSSCYMYSHIYGKYPLQFFLHVKSLFFHSIKIKMSSANYKFHLEMQIYTTKEKHVFDFRSIRVLLKNPASTMENHKCPKYNPNVKEPSPRADIVGISQLQNTTQISSCRSSS